MAKVLNLLLVALLASVFAASQEAAHGAGVPASHQNGGNVGWVVKEVPIYRLHVTPDQLYQLNLRKRIIALINATYADEARGIHDVKKFREIKKLARELEE